MGMNESMFKELLIRELKRLNTNLEKLNENTDKQMALAAPYMEKANEMINRSSLTGLFGAEQEQ